MFPFHSAAAIPTHSTNVDLTTIFAARSNVNRRHMIHRPSAAPVKIANAVIAWIPDTSRIDCMIGSRNPNACPPPNTVLATNDTTAATNVAAVRNRSPA